MKKCLWSLSFIYETCGLEIVQHLALLSAASIDHSIGNLRKDLLALGLMSVLHILKEPNFGTKRWGVRSGVWSPPLRPRDSFNSTLSKGKNEWHKVKKDRCLNLFKKIQMHFQTVICFSIVCGCFPLQPERKFNLSHSGSLSLPGLV